MEHNSPAHARDRFSKRGAIIRALLAAAMLVAVVWCFATSGQAHATARPSSHGVGLSYLAPEGLCPFAENANAGRAQQEQAMACLVAYARRRALVPAVRPDARLRLSASIKAQRVFACNDYSHTPCGDSPAVPFHQAHYLPGADAEECLAQQDAGRDTARETMHDWLLSPTGHGQAIINPAHRDFGLAWRSGELDGETVGLWVLHLGVKHKR
jgi:uncharacterized protein YkwD